MICMESRMSGRCSDRHSDMCGSTRVSPCHLFSGTYIAKFSMVSFHFNGSDFIPDMIEVTSRAERRPTAPAENQFLAVQDGAA